MNANEIHNGKDYIVKIGHNQVKVKVISGSERGWVVRTAAGKFMPVNNSERFIRPVEHVAPATVEPASSQVPVPANNSDKKLTMLDAAAEVLKGVSHPMSAKEIIVAMEDAEIWKSPAGKTPHCTLSAAILRDSHKENPRFQKTGKGMFALAENTQGGEPCVN
ncbi:MAG: winged helix-turn-helix domain-containing protein [Victivallales bacterium]